MTPEFRAGERVCERAGELDAAARRIVFETLCAGKSDPAVERELARQRERFGGE